MLFRLAAMDGESARRLMAISGMGSRSDWAGRAKVDRAGFGCAGLDPYRTSWVLSGLIAIAIAIDEPSYTCTYPRPYRGLRGFETHGRTNEEDRLLDGAGSGRCAGRRESRHVFGRCRGRRGEARGWEGQGWACTRAWPERVECSRSVTIGPSLRSVGIEDILEHAVSASAVLRGAFG